MRNLQTLKYCTNFFFYLLLFCYVLFIFTPIGEPLFREPKIDKFLVWSQMSLNSFGVKTVWSQNLLFISLANYLWIIIAFKYFKQLIVNFDNNLIFAKETEELLNKIGNSVLLCGFIFLSIDIISVYTDDETSSSKTFLIKWFLILIGYFFKVLAALFKKATRLKEENDLTI